MSDGSWSGDDFDARLRREAMAWLTIRTNDGLDPISRQDLLDFTIDGEMFRLMDRRAGSGSRRSFRQLCPSVRRIARPVRSVRTRIRSARTDSCATSGRRPTRTTWTIVVYARP